MKPFLLTLAFLACVYGRPEPPVGYNYPAPVDIRSGSSLSGSSPSSTGSLNVAQVGPVQVHKHVYVHAAPEEPETARHRVTAPVAPRQKHYKIIFIKAPSPPAYVNPIVPVQPQNEEKTLVYVLVKKPEDQENVVVPTPAPTKPSKPEVYFIKYKANKEQINAAIGAQAIDSNGLSKGGSGSSSDSYSLSGSLSSSSGLTSKYGPPN